MPAEQKPAREPHPNGPIFIPKSIGFGWTLNFSRWESYLIAGVLVVIAAGVWSFRKGYLKF